MSPYVMHWPSMGLENGEFVGDDLDVMNDPLARRVVLVGGAIVGLLSPLLLLGVSIAATNMYAATAGLSIFGGSALTAVFAIALAIAGLDVVLQEIVFSPLRHISGILALSVVYPVLVAVLWLRRDSTEVEDPERLASLAGEGAALRVLFSQMVNRRRNRVLTDGGQKMK
ncbi:hypothetical protein C475_17803 [Halosimplex carlsbadense 2-9-1]|uniref:Uncharacterized protein n=1 Tax=Halosimplex carlsbadense 2-9-1 TaxID=797114 RepID=M0CGK2_9EURY|nr:hypothetical protein [Halosimplex carlsbadense]ELZ22391.1 hypothetical protein C475_17803 [Halosimplex carlsbadense 2-9-1]